MSAESPLQLAMAAFAAGFGGEAAVMSSAPGRVELLGNHTDYNGGLVIAAAIDRRTLFVGRHTSGRQARVASVQFKDLDSFPLDHIERTEPGGIGLATCAECAGRFPGGVVRSLAGSTRSSWEMFRSGPAFRARRVSRLHVRCC